MSGVDVIVSANEATKACRAHLGHPGCIPSLCPLLITHDSGLSGSDSFSLIVISSGSAFFTFLSPFIAFSGHILFSFYPG
jgi:hypothetical protein